MSAIGQVLVALVFHVLDMATGLIGALKNKDLASGKMRDGLFKKVGYIFCYIVAFVIDRYGTDIGITIGTPVLPIIITYACITEVVSIAENISKINPDILPKKLLQMLHITETEE